MTEYKKTSKYSDTIRKFSVLVKIPKNAVIALGELLQCCILWTV